jgi:3-methyladenine DNA glycosylase AlkC
MDGQTKKLIVAFCNLADVPKNSKCIAVLLSRENEPQNKVDKISNGCCRIKLQKSAFLCQL